ncbi:LOW QUALITY PROTEIN: hypothetical protein Cgig2_013921 [Carnegiea gigantea]|uniref:Bidirectional sugar transporter SWEET n=1 Tax=Carnegiea gigantea TaxID=171969 RepID=A0A9Q1GRZ7_9CARY|nr:LOW QUALITY PROTEIN: hypothetical protein Cgig2_013921 [Carnegiea gigantea]
MIAIHHPWVFTFGLLGNIISFMVFLAPMPTFIRIYKKKSTEGFHSVPYVIAIFSCMLWIYCALLKGNNILLITINTAGIVIETIYIAIFITYAPKQAKISTLKLLMLLNFCGFCAIVLLCHYLAKGDARVQAFGWVCVAFSISVFAAPLSIMYVETSLELQRKVIRTKSVEYMLFNLSLSLTLTAVIWFTNAQKRPLHHGAVTPTSQAAPEEIEVVVGIPENEEGKIVHEKSLAQAASGPTMQRGRPEDHRRAWPSSNPVGRVCRLTKGKKYTLLAVHNKRLCKGSLQKHSNYVNLVQVLLRKILEDCVERPSLLIKGTIKDFQVYTAGNAFWISKYEYYTNLYCL